MVRRLARIFEVDLRSLALFRVAIGAVFLWDVATRALNLRAHYSEDGVLPVEVAAQVYSAWVRVSPFGLLSAHPAAIAALFVLMAVAGAMLVVGYRTRAATLVCWALLTALQLRNHMVAYGGDPLLRVLLFWSFFLPLGGRWSADALRRPGSVPSNRFASLGSAAMMLQIATVYWVTGLWKVDPAWFDGTAVWYALNLDLYVTHIGIWLRDLAWLIPILTYGTLGLEVLGPCVALSPIWSGPLRTLVVFTFAGFHAGMWLSMDIGFFQPLSIAAWLVFLPPWFWDELLPRIGLRAGAIVRDAPSLSAPRWLEAAVAVPLVYLVLFTSFSIGGLLVRGRSFELPGPVATIGRALRLNQHWIMFRGFDDRVDKWLVVDLTLADGRHLDPYRGGPVSWEKEELIAEVIPDLRWRLVTFRVISTRKQKARALLLRDRFAGYLCRQWNASHEGRERAEEVTLVAVREGTRRDGVVPLGPDVLHRHRCGADYQPGQGSASSSLTKMPAATSAMPAASSSKAPGP
jgi:hypothetical protein